MKKHFKEYLLIGIRGWIGSLLIALLIATSFKSAIADWYVVPTGSMKPTIVEGDRVFTNKLAYDLKLPYTTLHIAGWDNPKRGDIVVFNSPADGKRLVKRVVGIPGDRIAMWNNRLFINDEPLKYKFLGEGLLGSAQSSENFGHELYTEYLAGHKHTMMTIPDQPSIRSFSIVTVPEGHYLMMGDNRDNSADSRYFGFVERKQILGRATAVVISLDLDHHYQPRWERFFTKLQ
ncbi:MAG: signal peptidase I [Thermodesulfobacteriota bacterium]|jgi:signal peptidase I